MGVDLVETVPEGTMNTRELRELAAEGESERLEFKKSTGQRIHAVKTLCAVLNGPGCVIRNAAVMRSEWTGGTFL